VLACDILRDLDLELKAAQARIIQEIAEFLCRDVDEVEAKIAEGAWAAREQRRDGEKMPCGLRQEVARRCGRERAPRHCNEAAALQTSKSARGESRSKMTKRQLENALH
jgi:hypothetical protein